MPNASRGIAEVCATYGVTPRALRFYEEEDLLHPIRMGWARTYSPADCVRLEVILKAKRLGFSIAEIRKLLGPVGEESRQPDGAVNRLSKDRLLQQISLLQERRDGIQAAITQLKDELAKRG